MQPKKDYKVPMTWVNRIFDIMEEIYQARWTEWQGSEKNKELYKTIWCTGLYGLTVQEIRSGLTMCKNLPQSITPPHVIEFYHYAKGTKRVPHRNCLPSMKGNSEIAKKSIEQIKNKLRG